MEQQRADAAYEAKLQECKIRLAAVRARISGLKKQITQDVGSEGREAFCEAQSRIFRDLAIASQAISAEKEVSGRLGFSALIGVLRAIKSLMYTGGLTY